MLAVTTPDERGARAAGATTVRYSVEIERGLPLDAAAVASTVAEVLTDRRGWQAAADIAFVPVQPRAVRAGARVDVRVTVASPALTDRLCAPLQTRSELSCWQGGRAVLNARRWVNGSATYGTSIRAYRTYLVNHEVGHGLGRGHESCPARGRRAPVMVQQSKSLDGCKPWPWPGRR